MVLMEIWLWQKEVLFRGRTASTDKVVNDVEELMAS